MNILEFIFAIIALIVGSFVVIGIFITIYDTNKLKEENEKLREDLKNARARKLKSEYKKAKEVK